jgi:hypothetical protein
MGTDVAAAAREAEARAAAEALLGVTAYCPLCRQICWLARRTSAQDALVHHTVTEASVRARLAYAQAGIGK